MNYPIPEQLLQATINYLNSRPSAETRGILNELEHVCGEFGHEIKAKADEEARLKNHEDLIAQGWTPPTKVEPEATA